MATSLGKCYSIMISGNLLKHGKISIRLPHEDIRSNIWQISLNTLSQEFLDNFNMLTGITCNFVTDIMYNSSNQIISNQPILWQALFKGNVQEKSLTSYEKSWFYVTNAQEILEISFLSLVDGKVSDALKINCNVYATILLQRIK